MHILAIDPGIHQGWCWIAGPDSTHETFRSYRCHLGDPPNVDVCTKILIECPQVYRADQSKADPNDLIKLALRVGRLLERFKSHDVRMVYPREWKGQQSKTVTKNRMFRKYPDLEGWLNASGVSASLQNNVIDAVGIADWGLDNWYRAWSFT